MKRFLDPLTSAVAHFAVLLRDLWNYFMEHPPATVFATALIAGTIAILSIRHQRATTRLRETFATINTDNWDEDVIKARKLLGEIRKETKGPQDIAKYCTSDAALLEKAETLATIMNDYENHAIGVRLNIIDEDFLYRWMRGALIKDWNTFSPLVSAYRHREDNQDIYIEFEGIALAWQENRSYRTGRTMKRAVKRIRIS